MRRAVGVGGLEVGERGGEGTEECLMRGHLAFLSMFNAVSHVGHQGLSRYCRTGSSLEPVTIRHHTVENMPRGSRGLHCITLFLGFIPAELF